MKLTLTQIGTPKQIQTKYGMKEKNYAKATEYPDKFLNFWVNDFTRNWKVGQVIEVENVEERDYTGQDGTLKKSYDIKQATKEDRIQKLLEEIASRQVTQGLTLQSIVQRLSDGGGGRPNEEPEYPPFQGQPDFDPKDIVGKGGMDTRDVPF